MALAAASYSQVGAGGLVFFGAQTVSESIASTAPVVQMSAGAGFGIALRADGSLVGWGKNDVAQARMPKGLFGVKQVASGITHSLLLLSNGTVKAIGWDNYGQSDVPVGLSNVVEIAAGDYFSMALKSDGTIVEWGFLAGGLIPPVGLTGVQHIATGNAFVLALKTDGSVVCWGSNTHGECTGPGGPSNIVGIAANYQHALAVRSDGTVTCWGENNYGENNIPGGLTNVVQVAAGQSHSVALKADGTVVGWGRNFEGEASPLTASNKIASIAAGGTNTYGVDIQGNVIGWGDSTFGQTTTPNFVGDITKIASGKNHVLMLRPDGSLTAWGSNLSGQCNTPNIGAHPFSNISAGAAHSATIGALTTSLGLFGDNGWNQLNVPGTSSTVDNVWAFGSVTYAHQVSGGTKGFGRNNEGELGLTGNTDFVQMCGGSLFSVGLKADGTVMAAGYNGFGQSTVPAGLSGVTSIASGANHTLALINDGTVVAWGQNNNGQLNVPAGLGGVAQVTGGTGHSAALLYDGTVVGWGDNTYGQAQPPVGTANLVQISAGDYYTVGLAAMNLQVGPFGVFGGDQAVGTVFLAAPAPIGGTTVTLVSSGANATPPTSVLVPAGQTSVTFPINTANPASTVHPIISATLGNLTQSSLMTINPSKFLMAISAPSVVGGSYQAETVTVTLATPAPVGGTTITFASQDPSLAPPSQVVIAKGATIASVPFPHARVHSLTTANFTASGLGMTRSASIIVKPFQLTAFKVSPANTIGGMTSTGTVSMNTTSRTPIDIVVTSSNTALVPNPGTVTVPILNTNWNIPVATTAVSATTPCSVTATLDGSTIVVPMSLIPALSLQSVVPTVVGGSTVAIMDKVTLSLPAPAGGGTVTLTSSDPATASVPSSVPISGGASTATFAVTHNRVATSKPVTISATYNGSTSTTSLTVNPFQIKSFAILPSAIIGGTSAIGTAVLNAIPAQDIAVTLSSNDTTSVPNPANLIVHANSSKGTGTILANDVATSVYTLITAALDGSSSAFQLNVQPALAVPEFDAASTYGACQATLAVKLSMAAPAGGITVQLTPSNCQLQTSSIIVPAGAKVIKIPVFANNVSSVTTMSVTLTYGIEKQVATETVQPNSLTGLVVTPLTFKGSSATVVTVTANIKAKVAYDVFVNVMSSDQNHVGVQSVIKIAAGTNTGSIMATHSAVPKALIVTLTANAAGVSRAVNLTVYP